MRTLCPAEAVRRAPSPQSMARALRERDPCFAASTYALTDVLTEEARKQGQGSHPPMRPLYINLRGAHGLEVDDPAWAQLEVRALTCALLEVELMSTVLLAPLAIRCRAPIPCVALLPIARRILALLALNPAFLVPLLLDPARSRRSPMPTDSED